MVRSPDGCQTRDGTGGLVAIDDHSSRIQAAHAVRDDVESLGARFAERPAGFLFQFVGALFGAGGEGNMRVMDLEPPLAKAAADASKIVEFVAGRDEGNLPDLAQLRAQRVEAGDAVRQEDGVRFGHE